MDEPEDLRVREAREMQQRYRNVFASEEGRRVLGDILTMGHFGTILDVTDPTHAMRMGEHNLAVTIAQLAGAFGPVYKQLGIRTEDNDGG